MVEVQVGMEVELEAAKECRKEAGEGSTVVCLETSALRTAHEVAQGSREELKSRAAVCIGSTASRICKVGTAQNTL
jgi:hypothetical protein